MTINITCLINNNIKHIGYRGKFSVVGSFYAFRIEDKNGKVTMAHADEIGTLVSNILYDLRLTDTLRPLNMGYIENGVVFNWIRV